jgi:hypothetical protein
VLVGGCASGTVDPDGGAGGDVDASAATIDGAPAGIDAAANAPDAAANVPDAAANAPDAAPPDATPPPDACVPGWIELLANPDFDLGAVSWTVTTDSFAVLREAGGGYPWALHSGTWGAIFGGYDDAVQTLSQTVTVPADATALRFGGYRCFVTEEITSITVYDSLTVQLRDGVTPLETLLDYSNLDAAGTCSWSLVELMAASPHAGETITLHFDASTDISNITSFGLDTLSLQALACP